MRIAVLLDQARLFRWHLALIEALKAGGHDVSVRFRAGKDPLPTTLTVILDFDHARGHTSAERFSTHMVPEAFARLLRPDGSPSDVTLDLSTGTAAEPQAGPVVRPLYNGSERDYAFFHALFDRRPPHLAIWHSDWPHVFAIGRPALDDPLVLSKAFDQAISRLVEGLVRFFAEEAEFFRAAPPPPRSRSSRETEPLLLSAFWYGWARTRRKLRRAADLFSGDGVRRYTAWRPISDTEPRPSGALQLAAFRIVEDDGARMFSDPCITEDKGVAHCFVTETPEATGVASVAHLTLGSRGAGPARTILSSGDGLARAFVFPSDGDRWMLAERAAGGVDLYRARRFPEDWVFETRLIAERLRSPTYFEYGGRRWLCGTSQAFESSEYDAFALYSADSVLGPWRAHRRNPVLVDGASAKPAGSLWRENGMLYRPGEDLIRPSGGVSIKRVDALTGSDYEEEASGRIAFAQRQGLVGPSTLTRGGGFEAIDFFARPSAVRASFRA